MNLPNKLTVLRVLMIPLFLFLFYQQDIPYNYLWALLVFALASYTDMLDGRIARKNGLVTDFGKLMDPLADKLLVMSAMVSFIAIEIAHPVIVIVILAREFLVTSIRMVAASSGKVIAADGWGKAKTVFQMVWICYGLLVRGMPYIGDGYATLLNIMIAVYYLLMGIVVLLTVISGFNYVWKNRSIFADM